MSWLTIIALAVDVLAVVLGMRAWRHGRTAAGVADVLIRTIESDGGRDLKRMASHEAARVGLTCALHDRVLDCNYPPDRSPPKDRARDMP